MADDFVPEGRVPLKSAIEQLAKARQTSVPLAKAEIRAKLHNGSIVAQAMERSTGRMFNIIPYTWGTETGLYWLESGTCLLPDENGKVSITTERFDMFYRPQNAPIFIIENDLRGLLGDRQQQDPDGQNQATGGKSSAAPVPQRASLRKLVRDFYEQLWPDGFKGRAKERDLAIQEKFEQLDMKAPHARTIQRALERK